MLAHLGAELDAEFLKTSVSMQSAIAPALPVDALRSIVDDLQDNLIKVSKLREMDMTRIKPKFSGTVTVDGMFKLYQAMMDAGIIKKAA